MPNITDILVFCVGVVSIITNGNLLLVLVKDPLRFFKGSSTYFILNLAVADMLTGANACAYGINGLFYRFPVDLAVYILSAFWITTQSSFLTIMAMSIERFLVINYPLNSRTWITKKRLCCIILIIWVISLILGGLILLPYPKILYVQFSIFTEFGIAVLIIAVLHVSILSTVRKSKEFVHNSTKSLKKSAIAHGNIAHPDKTDKKRQEAGESVEPPCIVQSLVEVKNNEKQHQTLENGKKNSAITNDNCLLIKTKNLLRHKQERKLTIVVIILVVILALTVLPYLLACQIYVGFILFCDYPPSKTLLVFLEYYFPIELLNFAINPLIYAWRLPRYRMSLKHLYCKIINRRWSIGSFTGSTKTFTNAKV